MAEPLVFAVIDDDTSLRRFLTTLIHAGGDIVVEARTLAEGAVVIGEYPWDVAIIDRRLPGGDGLDLCRAAMAHGEAAHRHIVILSASSTQEEKLRGFEAGADEYVAKPFSVAELGARIRAIKRSVAAQKTLLVRLAALEQLSIVDGLTQVYNYRFFETELRRLFDIAARHGRPLALAMIDLDHFKRINDTHGHRAGDTVLTEVSTAIMENVRGSDVLARYGGEEFAVILPETRLEEAILLGERLREAVAAMTVRDAFGSVRVTISVGVAAVLAAGISSPSRLVESADRALYAAKRGGRDRVEFHDELGSADERENADPIVAV
jgi:diguanylate cyclase (GGDEF)-like protein